MMHGGMCSYRAGSQLAAAVGFLRVHRARIALITLDIGANDPDSCLAEPSVARLVACAGAAIPRAAANLATILRALRRAGPHARIMAMNYYLPALAAWRDGLGGRLLARGSELAVASYNAMLTRVYRAFGVRVADVSGAFHTAEFEPRVAVPGQGTLPRNVAAICRWTWECAPAPRGPNEHPNPAGYRVIARAFLRAGARA
jgi:lysophospholipase L1-like esterase